MSLQGSPYSFEFCHRGVVCVDLQGVRCRQRSLTGPHGDNPRQEELQLKQLTVFVARRLCGKVQETQVASYTAV